MDGLRLLLQGLVLGFAIAAPVGPIGLLCIQRTLNAGRLVGLVSGLGAATADAFYGFVAAFGLTIISSFLLDKQLWLAVIGGVYLCYLGIRMMVAKPAAEAARAEGTSIAAAYGSTFLLTLTNPMTILFFVAVYAGAGLATGVDSYSGAAWMVVGVFLGSALWWSLLSGVTSLFRTRITGEWLRWVNVVAGGVIVAFGLFALWSVRA